MKKLFVLGILSLGALGMAAQDSAAGLFHRWCCGHHCGHHSLKICVRPYNAFTPICSGTLNCVGCNPFTMHGGPSPMMPPMMPPYWGGFGGYEDACAPSCVSSGCCDSSTLPAPAPGTPLPSAPGAPPAPGGNGGFTPPPPTPLPPAVSYFRAPNQVPAQLASYNNYYGYYGYPHNANYGYPQTGHYGYQHTANYGYPYTANYGYSQTANNGYPQNTNYAYPPNYSAYNPWLMSAGYQPNPWYGYPTGHGYPQQYGY
jgi:hypothetical protein